MGDFNPPIAPQKGSWVDPAGHRDVYADPWIHDSVAHLRAHGAYTRNINTYAATYKAHYGMPSKYGNKRKYGRKRAVARRGASRGKRFGMVSVPRGLPVGPAAPHTVRKLHMQYNRVINSAAAEYGRMEILGNSLVNPILQAEYTEGGQDIGIASEQVYGKDQMSTFYEDYWITGARIECTLMPTDTVTSLVDAAIPKKYPMQIYLIAMENDNTSHPVPTTEETFRELGAQQRLIPIGKVTKLVNSSSTAKVLGGAAYSTIRTSLDDTAYPTRTWKWVLHMAPFMSVGALEPWEVAVKIDVYYTVHFANRKELAQSTASAPA